MGCWEIFTRKYRFQSDDLGVVAPTLNFAEGFWLSYPPVKVWDHVVSWEKVLPWWPGFMPQAERANVPSRAVWICPGRWRSCRCPILVNLVLDLVSWCFFYSFSQTTLKIMLWVWLCSLSTPPTAMVRLSSCNMPFEVVAIQERMSKAIRRSFSIISCLYVDLYDMILCVHI